MRRRKIMARTWRALVDAGWYCKESLTPLYDIMAYKDGFKVLVKCMKSLSQITDAARFLLCGRAVQEAEDAKKRNVKYRDVYAFFAVFTDYGLFLIDALNLKRIKPIELEVYLRNQRSIRPFEL